MASQRPTSEMGKSVVKRKKSKLFNFSTDDDSENSIDIVAGVKCEGVAGKLPKKRSRQKRIKKGTPRGNFKSNKLTADNDSDVQIIDFIPGKKDSDIEVIDVIPGNSDSQVEITKVEYVDTRRRRQICDGKEMMGLTVDPETGKIDVIQNQMDDPRVAEMSYNGIKL